MPTADEMVKSLLRVKSDPIAKEKLIFDVFASVPDVTRKVQQSVDRAEQIQRNLHIAIALAAFRAEQGSYPKSLDALTPKYLDKIANDYFTGKPLVYRPDEKGYLLR